MIDWRILVLIVCLGVGVTAALLAQENTPKRYLIYKTQTGKTIKIKLETAE